MSVNNQPPKYEYIAPNWSHWALRQLLLLPAWSINESVKDPLVVTVILNFPNLKQVDIRAVKPNPRKTVDENKSKLHGAVLETFKYSIKPFDMLAYDDSGEWLHEITTQTHKMRFIATGGVLKGILKTDDEITNEDMIHINGDDLEQSEDTGERIGFSYMAQYRRYVYNPKLNEYAEPWFPMWF